MADRTVKLRRLKQIMRTFGIGWVRTKGKGSHGAFCKHIEGGFHSYTVPDETDVLICYVRALRKKFKLTSEDGVSDNDFYNA